MFPLDRIYEKINEMNDVLKESILVKCTTQEEVQFLKKEFRSTKFMGIIGDTFTCCICLDIIKPPVVVASCCKRVVSCKVCNDNWIATTCPHCRSSESVFVDVNCFNEILEHYMEISNN